MYIIYGLLGALLIGISAVVAVWSISHGINLMGAGLLGLAISVGLLCLAISDGLRMLAQIRDSIKNKDI